MATVTGWKRGMTRRWTEACIRAHVAQMPAPYLPLMHWGHLARPLTLLFLNLILVVIFGCAGSLLLHMGFRRMGIFPDQGSKSVCPALAGGFLTTGPPGRSPAHLLRASVSESRAHWWQVESETSTVWGNPAQGRDSIPPVHASISAAWYRNASSGWCWVLQRGNTLSCQWTWPSLLTLGCWDHTGPKRPQSTPVSKGIRNHSRTQES